GGQCQGVSTGTGPGPMGTLAPPGLPLPDLQLGELQMADGIMLTAKKFNLAITFFYHAQESLNAEYGRVRSASTRCQVLSSTSSTRVSLLRGDFRELGFTKVGTSGGVTTYSAVSGKGTTSSL